MNASTVFSAAHLLGGKVESEFGGDFSRLLNISNASILVVDFILSEFLMLSLTL